MNFQHLTSLVRGSFKFYKLQAIRGDIRVGIPQIPLIENAFAVTKLLRGHLVLEMCP